jgi:hypothetical protein
MYLLRSIDLCFNASYSIKSPHAVLASFGHVNCKRAEAKATPNPSIEGMPKRLCLLCTPHVKR